MTAANLTTEESPPRQYLALLIYLIVVLGLAATAFSMISYLADSYAALEESRIVLARLDKALQRSPSRQTNAAVNGPPFLVGKTITIAGAALQERVEAAVKNAGGNVLSSQTDLQGPHAAEGFVGLTESLEIDQAALQALLYDLEAGMPYLFVDKLAIQAPQAFGEAEGTPMRVLIVVSAQWRETQ
jgi:general secretion pathway protein M